MAVGEVAEVTHEGNGYTASEVIAAIRGSRGLITEVAARLGCSRTHVYRLLDKFSTAKIALSDEREALKDFAEDKLFNQIKSENLTAITFYLKTQAKDRGYVERQEVELDANQELKDWIKSQQADLRNG